MILSAECLNAELTRQEGSEQLNGMMLSLRSQNQNQKASKNRASASMKRRNKQTFPQPINKHLKRALDHNDYLYDRSIIHVWRSRVFECFH